MQEMIYARMQTVVAKELRLLHKLWELQNMLEKYPDTHWLEEMISQVQAEFGDTRENFLTLKCIYEQMVV
jgi:hypothetical protein